jgi:hypothetical protein
LLMALQCQCLESSVIELLSTVFGIYPKDTITDSVSVSVYWSRILGRNKREMHGVLN